MAAVKKRRVSFSQAGERSHGLEKAENVLTSQPAQDVLDPAATLATSQHDTEYQHEEKYEELRQEDSQNEAPLHPSQVQLGLSEGTHGCMHQRER